MTSCGRGGAGPAMLPRRRPLTAASGMTRGVQNELASKEHQNVVFIPDK